MTTFYVFGESQNDTTALTELIKARADAKQISVATIPLRAPLIQQKATTASTRRTNADKVASAVKARQRLRSEVAIVIVAHEDCDDVEPAHEFVAGTIEAGLGALGFPIVAAAPAFEMEAWWFLWPTAVAAVCSAWKPLRRSQTEVGLIVNAKETLKRELRPSGIKVRDYSEADGPSIARQVRILKLIDHTQATSASFVAFDKKISAHI